MIISYNTYKYECVCVREKEIVNVCERKKE